MTDRCLDNVSVAEVSTNFLAFAGDSTITSLIRSVFAFAIEEGKSFYLTAIEVA